MKKRGDIELDTFVWIVISVAVAVLIVVVTTIWGDKGTSYIDVIKRLFSFR